MTKICTTIEQSKKLLELGLSPDTADMFWFNIHKINDKMNALQKQKEEFEKALKELS